MNLLPSIAKTDNLPNLLEFIRVEGWVKGDLQAKQFRMSWIRVQRADSSEIRQNEH